MLINYIKNNIFIILFASSHMVFAQRVYVGSGMVTAGFKDYVNSVGENTLDDSGFSKSTQLFFEGGVFIKLHKDIINLDAGLQYNTNKINTSFYSGNLRIPTTYDLSYLGLKVGFNVNAFNWKSLNLLLHFNCNYDYLIRGTNTYRNVVVDLYKDKTLDRSLFILNRGIGLEYKLLEKTSLYLKYNRANSIREKNQEDQKGEQYTLVRNVLTLGVIFDLEKRLTKENDKDREKGKEKELLLI